MTEPSREQEPPVSEPREAPLPDEQPAPHPEIRYAAADIAALLTAPGESPLTPTEEQRAVIETPLGEATLVVAGAGSGKTETMANRVLWLVVNGLLRPDQVLGLTFTRKAAGELGIRIRGRLATLTEALRASRPGETGERAAHLDRVLDGLEDGLSLPEVSTYNSFASGIVAEFGPQAGLPGGATLIDQSTAWRLARRVVTGERDPELTESGLSITQLTDFVLTLDRAMSEHLTRPERVAQLLDEFRTISRLPYNEKELRGGPEAISGKQYKAVTDALEATAKTPLILRLTHRFAEEKRQRGMIEFSDQLALALDTIRLAPAARTALRDRHRAVLLDEYQDTSVGQTRLLAELFAGNSVMAVGDPHQSIYGWRGASSENLTTFPREFRARGEAGRSNTLSLSVSWRNASVVLDAANVVAAPLRAESAVPVAKLLPRPAAPRGSVETRFPETLHEETRAVAEWFAERRAGHLAERGELPTSALIFRNRGHMARFSQALDERGVPNRIIGLGGLLSTPEITDLVAALRCLWFADAGSELIRLLTGPRFGVGVLDLRALKSAASWFAERDGSHRLLAEGERGEDRALPDPDRQVTLLDALDEIARLPEGHLIAQKFTEPGLARLREAASVLSGLRARVGHGVAELVRATETALRLDIEVMANERAPDAGDARARGNLDAFHEIVEDFLRVDDAGSLASLLAWVERATVEDEHAEQLAAPDPNSVQLITAHGSKGLEWDLVAVPRLVSAEFPGPSKEAKGWLRTGVLPDALRGDAASRPVLDWRLCATQQEFKEAVEAYSAEVKARHADEERRLGYVALTRARSELLLTGSFWGGQTRPRGPSEYLTELAEAGLIPELPAESAVEENPLLGAERTLLWPLDPLGARREAVLAAAARVRAGVEARVAADAAPADLDPTVRLLLAERSAGRVPETPLAGARVNASAFHDVVADPRLAARRALRPMPQQPFRQTRVGNAFHEWVERRSATALGTRLELELADFDWDSLGAGPGSAGGSLDGAPGQVAGEEPVAEAAEPDPSELFEAAAADALTPVDLRAELAPLIATFERSRWASRQPELVELEVSVPFAGTRLVCKIDAVYRDTASTPGAPADADREPSYEIVDWKAGRAPRTEAERRDRFLQLDLYRHAFATWRGIPPERVRVSLFYVAEDLELTNEAPLPIAELERRWLAATSG